MRISKFLKERFSPLSHVEQNLLFGSARTVHGSRDAREKAQPATIFLLPDRIAALDELVASSAGLDTTKLIEDRVSTWEHVRFSTTAAGVIALPVLIALDDRQYFTPTILEIPNCDEVLITWTQISRTLAQAIVAGNGKPALREGEECWGSLANIFNHNGSCGLFSLAKLEFSPWSDLPLVTAVNDATTPFPGLESLIYADSGEKSERISLETNSAEELDRDLKRLSLAILLEEFELAEKLFREHETQWEHNSRAQFAAGLLYSHLEQHRKAAQHFHIAQTLDHPEALLQEWGALGNVTAPFRKEYPKIFDYIERGDGLRALMDLRSLRDEHPQTANAVLAYCLRKANEPEDGLAACTRTLELEPNQSDVLGHKWAYQTMLELDAYALETAFDHLRRYPQEPIASINAIDSLLLLEEFGLALLMAERYAIFADNLELIIQQLFKVYERCELWDAALERYQQLVPWLPNPSVRTMICHGDVLIETGNIEEAIELFHRALQIEPQNGKILLGLSRALARGDREDEAEQLLHTALGDHHSAQNTEDRAFLVTMLAQIQRRTGRAEIALATYREMMPGDLVDAAEKLGPAPALEYIEALLDIGEQSQARTTLDRLKLKFPHDPLVTELDGLIA